MTCFPSYIFHWLTGKRCESHHTWAASSITSIIRCSRRENKNQGLNVLSCFHPIFFTFLLLPSFANSRDEEWTGRRKCHHLQVNNNNMENELRSIKLVFSPSFLVPVNFLPSDSVLLEILVPLIKDLVLNSQESRLNNIILPAFHVVSLLTLWHENQLDSWRRRWAKLGLKILSLSPNLWLTCFSWNEQEEDQLKREHNE